MKYTIEKLIGCTLLGGLFLLQNVSLSFAQEKPAETKITFEQHVKPIFVQHCSSCHGAGKKEADLDLTNFTALMIGGGSGEVISAGSASDSYLYKLITHEESPEMPPSGTKIPDAEIKTIADWIDAGALENAGSKPVKSKPKLDLALAGDATIRPESVAVPLRMSLEPEIETVRPTATALATSPWAKLAAVAAPKQVLLYSTESLELLGVLPVEEGIIHSLKFSRDGSLLLGGGGKDGQSGLTILWDVKTGTRITNVGEELDAVLAADVDSSHQYIALGGPHKLVKVFSIADGSLRYEINKHTDWITAIEFSPDGKWLATGDRNGGLQVWETETGAERFVLGGHTLAITAVSWRADSKILASTSEDTTIRTWELDKGAAVKAWGAHAGGCTSIEFLRDGNLVSCGRDKLPKTWDQNGTLLRQFVEMPDVAVAVTFCDETNRVIAADWTGEIRVWSASDGVEVGKLIANPLSLQKRLAASQQSWNAANEKHQLLIVQLDQSKSKLAELTTALSVNQEHRLQTAAKIADTQTKLTTTQQQIEASTSQQTGWQTELTEKTTAHPLIEETFTKSVAAAAALPTDEELKQTVSQLEAKKNSIAARMTELQSLIAMSNEQQLMTKTGMDELAGMLQTDSQQLEKLAGEGAQLQSQIDPLTQQVELESQSAAVAAAEVAEFQRQIDKWSGNLEFIKQLAQLDSQLVETEQAVAEKQAIVDAAQKKLHDAQLEVDRASAQQKTTEADAEQIRANILELRGGS